MLYGFDIHSRTQEAQLHHIVGCVWSVYNCPLGTERDE